MSYPPFVDPITSNLLQLCQPKEKRPLEDGRLETFCFKLIVKNFIFNDKGQTTT